jgi:PAS domain S-box-containing protein
MCICCVLSFPADSIHDEQHLFSSIGTDLTLLAIRFPRIRRALFILAVVAGPAIGISAYRLATEVERDRAQAQLDRRVAAAALALERELAADLEVLYALRSPFETGVPVTSQRFEALAQPILARHPSLQALEWVPRIGHATRDVHEQSRREDGFEGYTITERDATGKMVVAGNREWYYPVALVAPITGNVRAIGFDLGSDPVRRKAIDRAAASGTIMLTDPVTLVQDTTAENGVLAFLAVYENVSVVAAAPEKELLGFVLAVLRLDMLLKSVHVDPATRGLTNIRFELVDGEGGFVVVHGRDGDRRGQPLAWMSAEQPIEVGGQRWHLVAFPTAEYMRSLRTRQPLLLAVIATVAWELLVGLVVVLGKRSRDRLERRHARLMRNIVESLADGIIVADTSGKILIANSAATAISGKGPSHVPPSEWSKFYGLYEPGTHELISSDQLPLMRAIRGEATIGVEAEIHDPEVPDGTFVSVSGAPLVGDKKEIRGGVVVLRDISDRKRAEEHLQRLSSAVEHTADSVLITDHRGTIEYVNPAFEATTGYTREEVLGRNPNILKSGVQGPEYYRELWQTILRGDPFQDTTVNRKKNGELYYAEQTITAIKDTNGNITHFVSVLKDMTERRKLQEQEIEMELAAEVQRRLFPARAPQIRGYDLAGSAFPAEATSGDYFDFIKVADDVLAMVVADVTGHGVGPALVMAQVRAHLRSLFHGTEDLVSIMDTIDRFLAEDLDDNLFVTMLLAKLEPTSGKCTYVNAGHPSAYVVNQSGEVAAEMASVCLPLGLFPDRWRCTENTVVLGEGDITVLVTDGILESTNPYGEEFGTERLLDVLRQNHHRSAREIVDQIRAAVREFAEESTQTDDLTVVICKRLAVSDEP